MINLFRSLPQGLFWYPFLGFLVFSLGRAVWGVREGALRRRRRAADELDRIGSVAVLVRRAVTDQFAEQELQRRCIGLLLQLHGYGGYSVDNCRSFLDGSPPVELALALAQHLDRLDRQAPARTTGPGILSHETETVVAWIEKKMEAGL